LKLNADFNGILIEDELHANVGPSEFALNHDTIMDDGFSIYTEVNQTGEELVLGTDYEFLDEDTRLSSQTNGKRVYTKVRVLNEDYQGTNLYITYKTVGDYAVAEDINAAVEKVLTPQLKAELKVDLTNPEMVPTWPFVLNHTKNHMIEFPSGRARAVCCDDKYVYVGVRSSDIIKIDAHTKEPVLSANTGFTPLYMLNLGNYLFIAGLSQKIIKYDTDTLTEVGRSQSYSAIVGLAADYDYLYCLVVSPARLVIIDPNTMEEIRSIDLSSTASVSQLSSNAPLIICGKDQLVFKGRVGGDWPLIWVSRTNPGSIIVSNFSADVYPTGTIFFQDDRFFSIDQSSNKSTIERVGVAYGKTEMLTFSTNNGFENIKATTDGKYVYFVGSSNDPPELRVIKYDPIKNKIMKKTVQGALEPKAVASNGRQLIVLCDDSNSDSAKLLFLNTRMEE
jgi:hypothetical protein